MRIVLRIVLRTGVEIGRLTVRRSASMIGIEAMIVRPSARWRAETIETPVITGTAVNPDGEIAGLSVWRIVRPSGPSNGL